MPEFKVPELQYPKVSGNNAGNTEFKVAEGVLCEIENFKQSGEKLKDISANEGVIPHLPAAEKFFEEQKAIEKTMRLYARLVAKDAADLLAMTDAAKAADKAAAANMGG